MRVQARRNLRYGEQIAGHWAGHWAGTLLCVSERELGELYGIEGKVLYRMLQRSQHGRSSFEIYGTIPELGRVWSQFWRPHVPQLRTGMGGMDSPGCAPPQALSSTGVSSLKNGLVPGLPSWSPRLGADGQKREAGVRQRRGFGDSGGR